MQRNSILGAVLASCCLVLALHLASGALFLPAPAPASSLAAAPTPSSTPAAEAPVEDINVLLASANPERGSKVARKCVSCHTFLKGEPNKIGPNLWNIVGRQAASDADFGYSSALSSHNAPWSYQELSSFLKKPRSYIRGTNMAFVGLKKVQQRADIIAYLRTLSDNPKPLP